MKYKFGCWTTHEQPRFQDLLAKHHLHTRAETGRMIVLEKGGDYLLTVKNNQPTLNRTITTLIPAPEAGFSPSEANRPIRSDGGVE
jgi:hypothetical protein